MSESLKVSIIIDTYNHEKFIAHAIRSVLDQNVSLDDVELIVVDDGSTDRTPEIVREYAPRVRYLSKPNGGQASAFNFAIPQSRGEIVFLLDGDDWWFPNKLRTVLDIFERHPEIGAVGHAIREVYDDGTEKDVAPDRDVHFQLHDEKSATTFLGVKALLGTSRFAARRWVFDKILPIPEILTVEADEYLFTLAAALAPSVILSQPLTYYRLHGGNLFQFHDFDVAKVRRKHNVLAGLVETLPERLREIGLEQAVIDAVLQPVWVESERLRLQSDGGRRWETFRVEKAAFEADKHSFGFRHRLVKRLFLGLTLLLPPTAFFALRRWYSREKLSRVRELFTSRGNSPKINPSSP